jgi:hypothetical protein
MVRSGNGALALGTYPDRFAAWPLSPPMQFYAAAMGSTTDI